MTTDKKNEFLAEYMGWRRKGHVKFTHSWDSFQLAFQKAKRQLPALDQYEIGKLFIHNEIEAACDILIEFLKEETK